MAQLNTTERARHGEARLCERTEGLLYVLA